MPTRGLPTSSRAIFFKALKSPRRLANIPSLNDLLAEPMSERVPDPYARCAELDGWDIYAVGGHYQKAACFDKKTENSKGELRATATGHFFRMNMRTHHMSCLGMANPEDGKKKARDMTAIRLSDHPALQTPLGHREDLPSVQEQDERTEIQGTAPWMPSGAT